MENPQERSVAVFNPSLPITNQDLEIVSERRSQLIMFVRSQMRASIDYGIIKGCTNPSLYKPGSEKLAGLFKIGISFVDLKENIDLHANFAMFSYKAQAFDKVTGKVLGELWGSCNSHEKKYRTRRIYDKATRKEAGEEETPVGDILNTLQKMAQKRASVGVIIQVVGASDFYTQDIDSPEDAAALGIDPNKGGNPSNRVQANVPNATKATSNGKAGPPICCTKPMMISKWNENQWYCVQCKTKLDRDAVAKDVGGQ